METSNNLISLDEKLNSGEKVICKKCQKGTYKPFNPKYKINHCFMCDYCGYMIRFEPNVVID